MQNGFAESFIRGSRDECLNEHLFGKTSIEQAQASLSPNGKPPGFAAGSGGEYLLLRKMLCWDRRGRLAMRPAS